MLYHPRNKNISLGALIEAIYYSQITRGEPDPSLLEKLRSIVDHCTACGKCTGVCTVKIESGTVALELRNFLDQQGCGGHPIKTRILNYLVENVSTRAPLAAKLMRRISAFLAASTMSPTTSPVSFPSAISSSLAKT